MHRRFILPLLLIVLAATASHAQWIESRGITGHEFTSVLAHNGVVFVGTRSGGLFQSSGADFIPIRQGLPIGWIQSLETDAAGTLYAGVRDDANYRSTDAGQSWSRLNGVVGTMTDIVTLGSYTFMATERGLYRSTIGSALFTLVDNQEVTEQSIGSLATENGVLFAGSYFSVLRSTDTGATWSRVVVPDSLHFSVGVGSLVSTRAGLTAVAMRFRFISTDNGLSFTSIPDDREPMVMKMITDGDRIIAAMDDGLYASTDGGRTFTALVKDDSQPFMDVTMSGDTIIAVTFDKIFTSTDRGASWTARKPEIEAQGVVALASGIGSGSNDLLAASDVLYRSQDGGMSFERTNDDSTSLAIRDVETGSSYVFALAGPFTILRSSDNGANWQDVSGVLADSGIPVACFHVDGSNVYAASYYYGVYYSTDNGDTWGVTQDGDPTRPFSNPTAFASYNGKIYLATQFYMFSSTDDGLSWHTELIDADGAILTLSATSLGLYATTANRVYRLENDNRWKPVGTLEGVTVIVDFYDGLFAGTAGNGVWMSPDNGESWEPYSFSGGGAGALTGNAAIIYDLYLYDTHTLVAATGSNVWISVFGGNHVRENPDLPRDILARHDRGDGLLHLSLSMPRSADVEIDLVDLRGRVVRRLLDERLDGDVRRTFPLAGFPAGLYFVTVRTENGSKTMKLPVIGG